MDSRPGLEIGITEFAELQAGAPSYQVLDVREPWEIEICALAGSLNIPMSGLPARVGELPKDGVLVVLCHHGARSLQVAAWLRHQGFDGATSLAGGIDAWATERAPELARY